MNDWFADFTRLAKGSKARADAVNALFDLIVTGMDKMPSQIQMNSGTRNFAADTGTVNAYACTLSHVAAPVADGQHIVLFVDAADVNTSTSVTLNVSAVGNVAVKFPDGTNPAVGDIIGMCEFRYSDTDSVWHFVTASLAGVAAAAASAAAAATSESNAASSASAASTSEANAGNAQSYSEEWANKAEDSLVSAAAGGNEVDEYSSLHHAAKAAASASTLLNTKVIDIGDWDMVADSSTNVAHGLSTSWSKIRSISALIRDDFGVTFLDFASVFDPGQTGFSSLSVTSVSIGLLRAAGGEFDSVSYDSTSFNRGWITIQYTD